MSFTVPLLVITSSIYCKSLNSKCVMNILFQYVRKMRRKGFSTGAKPDMRKKLNPVVC